ncbi:MAG: tRNA pseudouridine38-40 synthase [Pelagibacterales bacterium]|nr:tRNA pseudouridine38-40 synthase [Pelagibacterales bacterium]
MYNYQMVIEYDGTDFVGWQIQKNGPSIQGAMQSALKRYFKKKILINGAGRTDSGVHALRQSANFYTNTEIINKVKFINSINFFLKKKLISIVDLKKKNIKFHARFSAKKRIYKYIIFNRVGTLSINKNKGWLVKKKLDVKLMKKGANLLLGTNDYSTFRASSCNAKSPIKTIDKSNVMKTKEKIYLTFESKSFLQQQVRSMVGCLKYLGEKKFSLKDFKKIMQSKNRSNCAPLAPPEGLFLYDVKY